MNKVQERILQIFREFTHICDSIGTPYYLVCGSALGAVKYNGFIPWDDDMDVAMLRKDYEKFCLNAPKMLPSHLFLQNYHTDPFFPAIYSKLRDSETTYIEQSARMLPINHGLCIDIFPLDGYPADRKAQYQLELRKKYYIYMLSIPYIRTEYWKEQVIRPLRNIGVGKNTAKTAGAYTEMISAWSTSESALLANHGNWQGKLDYHKKEIYGYGCLGQFEGMQVWLPARYKEYLYQKYGDFFKEPPPKNQKSHHNCIHIDPDRPYTDYIKCEKMAGGERSESCFY